MEIKFSKTRDGGFAAWVPGTNVAAYAYPTSATATKATWKNAASVAADMIARNMAFLPTYVETCGYSALLENARIIHAKHA